jgi:hypothetical protein
VGVLSCGAQQEQDLFIVPDLQITALSLPLVGNELYGPFEAGIATSQVHRAVELKMVDRIHS